MTKEKLAGELRFSLQQSIDNDDRHKMDHTLLALDELYGN